MDFTSFPILGVAAFLTLAGSVFFFGFSHSQFKFIGRISLVFAVVVVIACLGLIVMAAGSLSKVAR